MSISNSSCRNLAKLALGGFVFGLLLFLVLEYLTPLLEIDREPMRFQLRADHQVRGMWPVALPIYFLAAFLFGLFIVGFGKKRGSRGLVYMWTFVIFASFGSSVLGVLIGLALMDVRIEFIYALFFSLGGCVATYVRANREEAHSSVRGVSNAFRVRNIVPKSRRRLIGSSVSGLLYSALVVCHIFLTYQEEPIEVRLFYAVLGAFTGFAVGALIYLLLVRQDIGGR